MVMPVPHSPLEQPKPQAPGEAWEIIAEELRRKKQTESSPVLAPVHVSRLRDDILQKERLDRLRQLLQVAFGPAAGRGEEEPSAPNEFDVLLCGGGVGRDSGVLRGMMRRLGVDCQPSENPTETQMRRRIKQLQTRRTAASALIDELEQEVVGLNSMLAVQAPVAVHRWQQARTPDDESCCLEELVPPTLCGSTASRGEVSPLLPPGPELRCELREQLRQANQEVLELRHELDAAQQMGSTAWESVKQVLQDSQPEASLLDGRRALLAFARGKARGTMIAEKLLDWDLRRKRIQAAILGWKNVVKTQRHAHLFKDVFNNTLDELSDHAVLKAVFSAWRHLTLQLWSIAAERRLRRFEEALLRISARLLAGDGHALLHLLFSQWRQSVRSVRSKSSGHEAQDKLDPKKGHEKGCCKKCSCALM